MRHILPNPLTPVLIFVKAEPEANIFLLEQIFKLSLAISSDELQNRIWSNEFKSMFSMFSSEIKAREEIRSSNAYLICGKQINRDYNNNGFDGTLHWILGATFSCHIFSL